MNGLEELFAKAAPKAGVTGQWFVARWQPDIATGEMLNIGIGFVSDEGELSLRLLNSFERLQCLFDSSNAAFHAELACQVIEECMRRDPFRRGSLFTGITIENRGFAQGLDNESVADRLYSEVVTLGKPREMKGKRKNFVPLPRDTAYEKLKNDLKKKMDLDFERHVPRDPYKVVSDSYGEEKLYLPFQRQGGVATLVSGAYADRFRVKSELFEGFRVVETARKKKISDDAALFVVLPGEGLARDVWEVLEGEFETFYSFVRRHDLYMSSHEDLDQLGDDITNWCKAA